MSIRILPAHVVDQIAAGEVLERPAHLIKELIENSIDAAATEIEVDFDQGGKFVRIQDNGAGISKDDLGLAIVRHATSKISASEDLFALNSFGFRGEALASVAAVSHLTITSRTPGSETAYMLKCMFGQTEAVAQTSGSAGTTIIVEQLFENVPARLKFLKSDSSEAAQIRQVIKAIAIAHPGIQFRVRSKSQLLHFWPARLTWKERAEEVLNVPSLFEADGEENGIQVRGLLASPDQTLQQNRGLWIFVQGRWVQDRALMAAIMESYRNLLMHGEFPIAVLSLHVPKDFVDVNVHPTKTQVKFVDSQKVFRAVVHTLRAALEVAPWLGKKGTPFFLQQTGDPVEKTPLLSTDSVFQSVQYQKKIFPVNEIKDLIKPYEPVVTDGPAKQVFWARMEVLGQANMTYIIAQSHDEFYLIDQHAAHERIVFEKLMVAWKSGRFDSQNLLIPIVIDLPPHEMEGIEWFFAQLGTLGLQLEKMGPESVAVSPIPTFVSETAVVQAIKSLAHEIAQNGGSLAWEKRVGDIFASMACHSVVRAGQTLSHEEMKGLLQQMDEFPLSTYCPHGRPVSVSWMFSDLERKFGRIT